MNQNVLILVLNFRVQASCHFEPQDNRNIKVIKFEPLFINTEHFKWISLIIYENLPAQREY